MKQRSAGARRAGLATSLLAAAGILVWAGPSTATVTQRVDGSPVTPDAQFAALAAAAAWVVLLWLVLGAALSASACLPGLAGRTGGAMAGRIAPAAVRRIVEAALGIAVTAAMASPGAALAGPAVQRPPVTRAIAGAQDAPTVVQFGDRVVTSDAPRPPLQPPGDFDRPGQGRAPTPPRPTA
ncbi:MAG: hypothetical protein ABIM89_07785, partial [Mycobacteriales bacterium]